jgi:hypothetical protein
MAQVQEVFLFQPTSITGCQLWLDGTDVNGNGTTVANGASVSTWVDKSGNGRNATTGGSSIPTFRNNSLLFNGNGQYDTSYSTILTNESFFIVYRWDTISSDAYLIWGSSGNQRIFYVSPSSSRWLYLGGIAAWGRWSTNALTSNVRYLAEFTTNMTVPEVNLYLNGSALSSLSGINSPTPFSGSPTTSRIGTGHVGEINEIIGFNVTLSTFQRQQIEGYLAWKWGLQANLPADNPFKTYRPLAQTPIPTQIVPMPTRGQTIQAFAPTQISGCQLWLDGADPAGTGILPANGATVSTWIDKSGNGFNATAAPSRTAGTYSTSFRAVNFETSTTGYITNYTAAPTNETMFVVFNNPTASLNNNILIGGVQGARSLGAGYSGNGGIIVGVVGNLNTQVAWLARTDLGSYTVGTTALVTSQFTTSTNTISLNGGTAGSGGAPGFTAGRVTYLGVDATNATFYYVGYAMEIIFYNSVLNTTQRQQVEGYLAWKWGLVSSLPNGHPYKQQQIAPFPFRITPFRGSLNQWQPTQISGCQLWLDGADSSSITGTTSVTEWRDKSGNTRHMGVGSGTTSYSSGAIQLTNSYMFVTSAVNLINVTVFIIAKTTGPQNQTVFTGRPNSSVNWNSLDGFGFYMDGTTVVRFYGQESSGRFSTFSVNTSTPRLFSFKSTGTSVSGWYEGVSQSGGTLSSTRTSTAQGFAIGGEWQGSSYGNIITNASLYEIIVYNSDLTDNQRQQIEGYLAWKWGLQGSLPSTHPYKTLPPPPS